MVGDHHAAGNGGDSPGPREQMTIGFSPTWREKRDILDAVEFPDVLPAGTVNSKASTALAVLRAIESVLRNRRRGRISIGRIEKLTGFSRPTVERAIRALRKRGVLRSDLQNRSSGRTWSEYEIDWGALQTEIPADQNAKPTHHESDPTHHDDGTHTIDGDLSIETISPDPTVSAPEMGDQKIAKKKRRKLTGIQPEDLTDLDRFERLYDRAVAAGVIGDSESDRLDFFAARERTLDKAKSNPPGFFASIINNHNWHLITAYEDRARATLRELRRSQCEPPEIVAQLANSLSIDRDDMEGV